MKELTKKQKAQSATEKEMDAKRAEALEAIQVCHICGKEYPHCRCGWGQ